MCLYLRDCSVTGMTETAAHETPQTRHRRRQLEAERALLHDEIDARNVRLDEIRDELAGLPE